METNILLNHFNSFLKIYTLLSLTIICLVSCTICPRNQSCDCTANYINCTCNNRDDLIITNEHSALTVKQFIIKGCGKVEIQKLSLTAMNLDLLCFVDLLDLKIQPYSFSNSYIQQFVISNVTILDVEAYAFSEIKNVTNLSIVNVSAENIPPACFSSLEAETIELKDSHIGTVHSRSFSLFKTMNILFENVVVNTFDITSFVMREGKKFTFIRSSVMSTAFGTFSLADMEEVDIGFCSFRQIHSNMIITKNVKSFQFHNSFVENSESRAFWSVEVINHIRFSQNEIMLAEEDSLIPNVGPHGMKENIKIEVEGNSLTCDCHLQWLFDNDEHYEYLLNTTVCREPIELVGEKLSNLTLSLNNVGNCVAVTIFKRTTPVPTISYTIFSTIFPTERIFSSSTVKTKSTFKAMTEEENEKRVRPMSNSNFVTVVNGLLLIVIFPLFAKFQNL